MNNPQPIGAGTDIVIDRDERGQPYRLEGFRYLLDHSDVMDREQYEPTATDLEDPVFNALWSVMRLQEVLLPGNLQSGATGNDVMIVLHRAGLR